MNRPLCTAALTCLAAAAVSIAIPSATPSAVAAPLAPSVEAAAMTDANALALLMAINNHEIAAANVALEEKKVDGDVEDFAEMMKKEHTANNVDTGKLATKLGIKPEENDDIKAMAKKEGKALVKMRALDKEAFSKAYIDSMVTGHSEALAKIDQAMTSATNEDLKKHLKDTRDHVAHHLEEATEVQAKLNKM